MKHCLGVLVQTLFYSNLRHFHSHQLKRGFAAQTVEWIYYYLQPVPIFFPDHVV